MARMLALFATILISFGLLYSTPAAAAPAAGKVQAAKTAPKCDCTCSKCKAKCEMKDGVCTCPKCGAKCTCDKKGDKGCDCPHKDCPHHKDKSKAPPADCPHKHK